MVHNGLIGGTQHNAEFYDLTSEMSIYDVQQDGSRDDVAALVQSIPSQDLLQLAIANYEENYEEVLPIIEVHSSVPTPLNTSDTFPNLDEHDNAGLGFNITLQPATGKGSWYYSSRLSKVFIRMDQTIYIQVEYCRRTEMDSSYHLRTMMVFRDDIGMPVKRCNNHKATSNDSGAMGESIRNMEAFIESVIRCENSNAQYQGTAAGKNVNDRLSVRIPLSAVKPDEKNIAKQSIALKFVCQNSCIGRRPTAVIFTLENKNGDVLGKKVLSVKICSCPKRDKEKEEEKKRSAEEANLPPGKRLAKKIKEEPEDYIPDTPISEAETINDELHIEINVPDKEFAKSVWDHCYAQITKRLALSPDNKEYLKFCKEYQSKYLAITAEDRATS